MRIFVRNRSKYDGPGEYIGRPAPLSNRYKIGPGTTRCDAVDMYTSWLERSIVEGDRRVLDELERLLAICEETGELNLVCWCQPKLCHGDVVKIVLLNKSRTGEWLSANGKAVGDPLDIVE
jgi:hypothetical protein